MDCGAAGLEDVFDDSEEFLPINGFLDVAVHAVARAALAVSPHGVRSKCDNGEVASSSLSHSGG